MKHFPLHVLGFAFYAAVATHSTAAVTLSGVYDPGSDANNVDASATFLSGTGGATAANTVDLATFKPLVASAFTNGTGGVLTFDAVGDSITTTTLTATTSGGTTANFTFESGNTSISNGSEGGGNRVATSGTKAIQRGVSGDFNFSSLTVTGTGAGAGTGFTYFGATVIHRVDNQTWDVTATFSGGGTVTFNQLAFTTGDTANSKDTFFGIVAPAGETITAVNFDGSSYSWLDDVAFITNVPEPSTALLGALGLLGLLRRRR